MHTLTPSSPRVIPGDDGGADLDTGAGAGDLAELVVTPWGGHHIPRDQGGLQTQPSSLRLQTSHCDDTESLKSYNNAFELRNKHEQKNSNVQYSTVQYSTISNVPYSELEGIFQLIIQKV